MARSSAVTPRWIAALFCAVLCLLPSEAHLSSYGLSQSRDFRGYQLSVTFPSQPSPSVSERARVEREQRARLDRATALAAQAFAHYVRGQHPYVAVRAVVLPDQPAGPDTSAWRTSPLELLDGVEIILRVRPGISDRIRSQVRRDFLLSQLAAGGILSTPALLAQQPVPRDPRKPEAVLAAGLFSLSQIVHALASRARIDAAIAREGSATAIGILLQGIRCTLDGQPLPESLFTAALALPPAPRAQTVQKLLDLSPRTDDSQVRTWAAHVSEQRRGSYIDPEPTR
jgi:hypothetical protein